MINPKLEGPWRDAGAGDDSDFWPRGDERACDAAALKAADQTPPPPPPLDLAECTAKGGEEIIRFSKRIPPSPVNNRLVAQLVGAGTSVGADYFAATDGISSKDFKQTIGICRKAARECTCFLRMRAAADSSPANEVRARSREAKESNLIPGLIWRTER